jgi:thiamine-monophosphate kinase
MDEAEFVGFLKRTFPFSHGYGIGDDTSVVKTGETYQLITKDILIEDVHFRLEDITLRDLAIKSLAVNVSDIAAMGGKPQYFYLGLGYPRRLPKENVIDFFKGMEEGCRRWKVELAGGDYSSSAQMFISITLVGTAENPIYRNGAKDGDLIGISGVTGESAIGLKLLFEGEKTGYFVEKHKRVEPEVEKGQVYSRYVDSMIDISDGLLLDLSRALTASGKGGRIDYEKIPVTSKIKEICLRYGWNEYENVLAGGEDYKLLFTISRENELKMRNENPGLEYYIIGEIDNQVGRLIVEDRGKPVKIEHYGYDHFTLTEK